jgi:hypothetical protein
MAVSYNFAGPRIVKDGLVLYLDAGNPNSYNFSTALTWRDISRNRNNGTLVNGVGYSSANGGNLIFDGSDDYIETPYTTAIGLNGFAYSAWIKYTQTHNGNIFSKRIGTPTFEQLSLYIAGDQNGNTSGTKIVFNDVQNLSILRLGITTNSYNDNNWHYVVLTRTSTTTDLYIDNTLSVSKTSAAVNMATASKLFIGVAGNNQTVAGNSFNGQIAQVQIYNRALSQAEITQNFQATRGRFGI